MKPRITPLLLSALVLVGALGALLLTQPTLIAQDEAPNLDYAGSGECNDCHRDIDDVHEVTAHAWTLVEIEEDMDADENPVVADFTVGEEARRVSFPDGERAFTLDDVAYTLGAGRHRQNFVTELSEGNYAVLPVGWNVTTGAWEDLELADEWPADAYAFGPQCAYCHVVGLNVDDYTWEEEGVLCEACHGPGDAHVEAADDAGGSIDDEERAAIYASIHIGYDSQTCGQCHVRGMATDGEHPYPVGYYPGINDLSNFYEPADPESDTHFWPTGHAQLPNMQFNEGQMSGHPNALASAQSSEGFDASCLACHSATQHLIDLRLSNEDIDPETVDPLALVEQNPHGVTCASCHHPHPQEAEQAQEDKNEDGEDVIHLNRALLRQDDEYALCVSCHSDADLSDGVHYPVQQIYEGASVTAQVEPVASAHFNAEDGPTCSTCHMPSVDTYNGERASHLFEIIPPGDALDLERLQDSCSGCHGDLSPQSLQQLMDDIQASTRQRIETAREAVGTNTPAWVTLSLDALAGDGSAGLHNYAYSDRLLDAVEAELNLTASASTSTE